jgi:hypothetical protein
MMSSTCLCGTFDIRSSQKTNDSHSLCGSAKFYLALKTELVAEKKTIVSVLTAGEFF